MSERNGDGQPMNFAFNRRDRTMREIDELIGLCKGIVADGTVNVDEALFLQGWLESNRESRCVWPCSVLYPRIQSMLEDGNLQNEEEKELLGLLIQVTGGNPQALDAHSLTSTLPLSRPVPDVLIPSNAFCFTGKFLYGTRSKCEEAVLLHGGRVLENITEDLDYLVIGLVGSRDWVHSTFGRKIEKAVGYRDKGIPITIVAEEHFIHALK